MDGRLEHLTKHSLRLVSTLRLASLNIYAEKSIKTNFIEHPKSQRGTTSLSHSQQSTTVTVTSPSGSLSEPPASRLRSNLHFLLCSRTDSPVDYLHLKTCIH
ncbi:hypothetical protein E2C01_037498 [Portunus trituberculatus]|uniref:Uncharacterized protein n=1 Tax=Portunus trituberculatus TaxID=210409 RepID=A0A5B7FH93_PORTR|nr:hypothetical protein [Portunus trituberculatus]